MRLAAAFACVALAGCGGSSGPASAPPPAPRTLVVRSADFAPGGRIPAADTCDGAGRRPALSWRGVPAGARELAVVVSDADAGGFVHWSVFALAPGVRRLPARGLPAGALEGQNSFGRRGWGPPCPPKGDAAHRYRFDVYWLRRRSGLSAGAGPKAVYSALRAAAGGRGEVVASYAASATSPAAFGGRPNTTRLMTETATRAAADVARPAPCAGARPRPG